MSISLAAKLALVTTMVIVTSVWDDGGVIMNGGCPYNDTYKCCVHACRHDSSTGCNGSSSCCENLCA
jgi:hypothetical protein